MSNIKLTYQYTLDSIKVINESIDKANANLALVLTFGGILVNFGKDLPGYFVNVRGLTETLPCPTCYFLKLIAYFVIIAAIGVGLWGISPINGGKIILPELLLSDEWNLASEENYITNLVEYLEKETLLALTEIRFQKEGKLKWAIRLLGIALLLLGLDQILNIYLSKPV